jgi:hypothetical protein
VALQGSLLLRFGNPAVADATLRRVTDFSRIVEKHRAV